MIEGNRYFFETKDCLHVDCAFLTHPAMAVIRSALASGVPHCFHPGYILRINSIVSDE